MIDIEIEDPAWSAALPDAQALVRIAAKATLSLSILPRETGEGDREAVEGARPGAAPAAAPSVTPSAGRATSPVVFATGEEFCLTVLLTDDASVRELNTRFRHKDAATNVLSFPAPTNPERFLGDIALAYGVCAAEAAQQGKPMAHHLQHLVAHGVLHLLGYDHTDDTEAEAMEGLERVVLAGLGIADPYAAAEGDHD